MVIKKKKKETTIDDLALMVAKGFGNMDHRMDSLDQGQKEIARNNSIEHDDIKIRLDNVAYRFELVELRKRVEVLERRNNIKIA